MTSKPGTPAASFPRGLTIHFESTSDAKPGDFVLAIHNGFPTFRMLSSEEGRRCLKPLNDSPEYPKIFDKFEIVAIAASAIWRRPR
ncbi:S24 family peptidase [Marinibactrum halimedae]|nr:S24 family peptidase [Marinibactrum halimedae]